MDSIFLDTNFLRNPDLNSFFGNLEDAKYLSRYGQLLIPGIVINEIKAQKYRKYRGELSKFKDNYFTKFLDCDTSFLKFCIKQKIELLFVKSKEELDYTIVNLSDNGHLDLMSDLAIKNGAPFDKTSDKGFKDAHIFYTILQWKDEATDDIFMITNDGRLAEALRKAGIIVLNNAKDYVNYREEYFNEEYFISKLNEFFETDTIKSGDVINSELTDESDWKLLVRYEGEEVEVLVDFYSREIIDVAED